MANIKTAISLHKNLFEQADALARDMKVTRSRLFVLALEDYLRRSQNLRLLERINATCEPEDRADRRKAVKMKKLHRKLVEGTW